MEEEIIIIISPPNQPEVKSAKFAKTCNGLSKAIAFLQDLRSQIEPACDEE